MKQDIVIRLKTASDPSGVVKMSGYLKGLGVMAGKVGEAFGGATTYIGQFAKNLMVGGIWEAGAAALAFLVKKAVEFATASARARRRASRGSTWTGRRRARRSTTARTGSSRGSRRPGCGTSSRSSA